MIIKVGIFKVVLVIISGFPGAWGWFLESLQALDVRGLRNVYD